MSDKGIEMLHEARLYMYRLLQAFFGNEPSEGLIDVLCSENTRQTIALFEDSSDGYDSAQKSIHTFMDSYKADKSKVIDAVLREYTTLFIGPDKLPAPPWESVYVSKDHLLFQESTLQVRRFYLEEGMLPAEYPHVADDHLALELSFMASLAQKGKECFEAGDVQEFERLLERQSSFLSEHILTWVDVFTDHLDGFPGTGLYPSLAKITAKFSHTDRDLLLECAART